MAYDLQKTIEIVFGATDNTAGVIDGVANDLDQLSGSIRQVTGPLSDVTTGLLAIEGAAAAAGLALAALALKAAGEFNDSFSEIATLTDASDEALASFRDELLDYAAGSTQAFDHITGATYSAISAGVDYADAVAFVTDAERLAVASKADLNETTTLLASTLNAFGAEADEAARYSDVLFTTVKLGQTTLPELASSLAQVSSTANAAGVPIEAVAAAVAELTAKGLPTSQAITGLKAALSNIIKPTNQAQDAAAELGVEFDVQALKAQGLDGLLRTLAEATGGNVEEMARLFGSTEALNAVMALAEDGAAGFTEKLSEMENASGAVEAAYAKMADNFELTNERIKNAVNAFLVEAGSPLESRWAEIGDAVSAVFASLRESVDEGAFDELYAFIDQFITRAVSDMEALAESLPEALEGVEWGGFLDSLGGVGEAIAGLFEGVDLTTPEGLREAIQQIVDVGEGLLEVTAGIVDGLKPFIRGLIDAIDAFKDLSPEAQRSAGEVLGFGTGLDKVLGLADGAIGALEGIASALAVLAGSQAASALAGIIKQLGGIKAPAASAAAALGKVGAVGAAGAGGWAVGSAILDFINERLIPGADTLGTKLYDVLHPNDIPDSFWRTELSEVEQAALRAAKSADEMGEANREALLTEQEMADAMGPVTELLGEQVVGQRELAEATGGTTESTGELVRAIRDAEGNIIGYEQAGRKVADTLDTQAESAREAAKATLEYQLKLLELASDERIANIEAKVSLDIAELEAQTKQVEAAFESIDTTVQSTGELLGDLFGALIDANSWSQKNLIEDQIADENRRREEAMEMQKKLIEAEIRNINARTKLMEQGGAEIKISAQGLEPQLEAFMFAVIDRVRASVAGSYTEFLLGCDA